MDPNTIDREYGSVTMTPDVDVEVGTYNTWTFTFVVGNLGMDDGSTLKLAGNMTGDWGRPQFSDPAADNYATVETSGDATVEGRYDSTGHVRPWKHTATIDVFDGSLDEGDTVTVAFGDRSGGSMGMRAQTFPETDFRFVAFVDPFGTGEFVRLAEDLTIDVVPGPATSIEAVTPSHAAVGEDLTLSVRAEDFWGNVATGYDGELRYEVAGEEGGPSGRLAASDGVARTQLRFDGPGTYRVAVTDQTGEFTATSNPVSCESEPAVRTYWGDLHGQSEETVGTGSVQEYFGYARDAAFLDFVSHAGNDFQITDAFWAELKDTVREFNAPDEFVTFLCYEWSANTSRGGDHNVYFRGDDGDLHRSSSWQIADGYDRHEGTTPVEALYDQFEGRDDVLIIPHQGGRPATPESIDPELSPFVEIVSAWGVFEWFGQAALDEGFEVGFVGGSDDHTGRPGASRPTNQTEFNVDGGLMGVTAPELTRDSLWEAFTQRRCYATTGARILLDTSIDGRPTGSRVAVDGPVEIQVQVNATDEIERVDVFRGAERVTGRDLTRRDSGEYVEFTWTGARSATRQKVQDWTGGLSLDRGRIRSVEPFGFDHPEQGVTHTTDKVVRWDGSTSGNYQGVRLALDAPDDAELSFSAAPVSAAIGLDELDAPKTFDGGHLDRRVRVSRVGRRGPLDAELTVTDDPEPGTHPYYVRVRQFDGEMAWSSPIFATTR